MWERRRYKGNENVIFLQKANNPEAVRTLSAHHADKMSSLLNETEAQLSSQRKALDRISASCTYHRFQAELCSQQVKVILSKVHLCFFVQ